LFFDEGVMQQQFLLWKNSNYYDEAAWHRIVNIAIPLFRCFILRFHWQVTLGADVNELVNELVIKGNRALRKFDPMTGRAFTF
jgi:hypothetical protein